MTRVLLSPNSKERMLYEKRKESLLNKASALKKAAEKGKEEGKNPRSVVKALQNKRCKSYF